MKMIKDNRFIEDTGIKTVISLFVTIITIFLLRSYLDKHSIELDFIIILAIGIVFSTILLITNRLVDLLIVAVRHQES